MFGNEHEEDFHLFLEVTVVICGQGDEKWIIKMITKIIEVTVPLYLNIYESLLKKKKKKHYSYQLFKFCNSTS